MKLKKVLASFFLGTLLAVTPILAVESNKSILDVFDRSIAKTSEGCDYFIRVTIESGSGTNSYSCYKTGEDANYCYYTCYLFNY